MIAWEISGDSVFATGDVASAAAAAWCSETGDFESKTRKRELKSGVVESDAVTGASSEAEAASEDDLGATSDADVTSDGNAILGADPAILRVNPLFSD